MSGEIVHARLPEGGRFDHWDGAGGAKLRVALWPGTRGTLLLANGRGDFIEKYGEAIRHWHGRGWAVATFDWRGQGGSGRHGLTPLHGASTGFGQATRDLSLMIGRAAREGPGPLVGAAHSMGGHLMLRAVVDGEARLKRVALSAPMIGIRTGRLPAWAAAGLAGTAAALGWRERFGPGQRARLSDEAMLRRSAALTGCTERGAEEYALLHTRPELAVGGVTWGWLADAFRSCAHLTRAGGLEAVRTPVLMVLAGDERVVDNAAAKRAVARLPRGSYVTIAGGRHELWREADGPRGRAFAAIDAFLEQA